jgi:predicted  nucleic acid-binding Zn-ribbon protein
MTNGLRLRYLSFHGPTREPAVVEFGPGLNVVFGASNTGKSFIVDTIDFMLGAKGLLRDIPERVGYNQILLAVETRDDEKFTIARSTEGGAFTTYDGLFSGTLPESEGTVLADQHNDKRDDNLSAFLLGKLGLSHKRVRKNRFGDTNSLSFRHVARLVIINEEEIIQQRSPLSDGSYGVGDTVNTSVFKLLLTGVDDSPLVSSRARTPEDQSRGGQLELLDQLIGDYRRQVKDLAGSEELEQQLTKLDATMEGHSAQLSVTEAEFRDFANRRRDVARKAEEARNRLTEINALLDRFTLLNDHYRSDIARLRAIEEAGSLFGALGDSDCPLCGARAEDHRLSDDCEGNIERVVSAAQAEIEKITVRQHELTQTIVSLKSEAVNFERRLPQLEERMSTLSKQIDVVVAPNLRQLRSTYKQLADKGGEVREALAIHRGLTDLQDRKAKLEKEFEEAAGGANVSDVDLSTSTADKFSTLVLELLRAWHFPEIERVHFDMKVRDLVINGKSRTSFGKGLRAITQAAFTIGLMEFCQRNETPHPGFVVLDSPLLSYREPESADDDLRGTDLNDHFYAYLAQFGADRQAIIIENTDPPANIQTSPQSIMFTGIDTVGRFGLFPPESAATT